VNGLRTYIAKRITIIQVVLSQIPYFLGCFGTFLYLFVPIRSSAQPLCLPPSNLVATNITSLSATLNWQASNLPAETTWEVELLPKNALPTGMATYTNISLKPFVLGGLSPLTSYDYYVRAVCSVGLASAWAGPFSFTTAMQNPSPCQMNLPIADNSCSATNLFPIHVFNAPGTQMGQNVKLSEIRLIIKHTWVSDIRMWLISPNNVQVELSTDNGGGSKNYGDPSDPTCSRYTAFGLDMCGDSAITLGHAPFIGLYQAEGNLKDFWDNSSPNGVWTLKICDKSGSDVGFLEFAQLVFSTNLCQRPQAMTVSQLGATSANLQWNVGNTSPIQRIVEYGLKGFTPGTGSTAGIGGTIHVGLTPLDTLKGLQPLTLYDVYVRESCAVGQFSNNSCVKTIETDCATKPITLLENFDTQALCNTSCRAACPLLGLWHNEVSDDFDWIVTKGSTPSPLTGPDDDVTGGKNYLYTEIDDNACLGGKKAILRSNCIKIANDSTSSCGMSFYWHLYGQHVNQLSLEISNNNGATWQTLWSKIGDHGNAWHKEYIDIQVFKNEIVQFRFVASSGTGFRSDLAIDNLTFYGATDLGLTGIYYRDADADGYGDALTTKPSCESEPPAGYVGNNTDCDDDDASIHPQGIEIACNGIDENCNGMADDLLAPMPIVLTDTICANEQATLMALGNPAGQYYWYSSPTAVTPLASGAVFTSTALQNNTYFYIQDTAIVYPGLRITEANLGQTDALEIQNIGPAKNYTNWVAAISDDLNNINVVNPILWQLGPMGNQEIAYQTKNTTDHYWGKSIPWTTSKLGWALILDDKGKVRDALFWNCPDTLIAKFNVVVNGFNIKAKQLPWHGQGVVTQGCFGLRTIQLATTTENNDASDYAACRISTITLPNNAFNINRICKSPIVAVQVKVTPPPIIAVADTLKICEGTSIDLQNVVVYDSLNSGGNFTYYNNTPTAPVNQLSSTMVQANNNATYFVKLTSAGGCSDETPIFTQTKSKPSVSITLSDNTPLCFNQSKTVTATSPNHVQYYWSTGDTSSQIVVQGAYRPNAKGTFYITATDENQCVLKDSVNIPYASGVTTAQILTINTPSTCQGTDGTVSLKMLDGVAPYSYQWTGSAGSGSSTSPSNLFYLTGLKKGTCSVTITDSSPLGCALTIPYIVISNSAIQADIDTIIAPSCPTTNDGQIKLNVSTTDPVTYLWNNNQITKNSSNLTAGLYSVTITSPTCEQIIENIPVTAPQPLEILSAIVTDVSCTNNGKINVSLSGGVQPYHYNWNNGLATQDLTAVPAGMYQLTITDARGCKVVSSVLEIANAPALKVKATVSPITCPKGNDGSISLYTTGGAPPYSYHWNDNTILKDRTNLVKSTHLVTVTDAAGCAVLSDTIVVNEPYKFSFDLINNPPTCTGINNGSLQALVSGASPPYQYYWSNQSSNELITNLASGAYGLTITDTRGCVFKSGTISLLAPPVLEVKLVEANNPTCKGKLDGNISISIVGGNAPYKYNWTDQSITRDLMNIDAGLYSVSVTDKNGCTTTKQNIELSAPQEIALTKDSLVSPLCYGYTDGKIFTTFSGGTQPYSYKWNTGGVAFQKDIFNLSAGNYSLTVTDQNQCSLVKNFTLSQPNSFAIQVNSVDSIMCNGGNDGGIDVNLIGGTPPFTYTWNNGKKTQDLSNIPGGMYNLIATDWRGCITNSGTIPVHEPNRLKVTLNKPTNGCNGVLNGILEANVTGGSAPYNYRWSTNENTPSIVTNTGGIFNLTLTDNNNCHAEINAIDVPLPIPQLLFSQKVIKSPTCHNGKNGQIICRIQGGVAPYTYKWGDEGHVKTVLGDTLLGLYSGGYSLTITDAKGCMVMDSFVVINPPLLEELSIDFDNVKCKGSYTGRIDITSKGGTLPYNYLWSDGNTNKDRLNLHAGNYSVTLTDNNGCVKKSSNITIGEPATLLLATLDSVKNVACTNGKDGQIRITAKNGEPPYNYKWLDLKNTNNIITSNSDILTNQGFGDYKCTIKDAVGCEIVLSPITITEPAKSIGLVIQLVTNNRCADGIEGAINISPTGGASPYTYIWSNGQTTKNIDSLAAGTYQVKIVDKNKCEFNSSNINITAPPIITVDSIKITATKLNENKGKAQFFIKGGEGPYKIIFNNGSTITNNVATNLSVGTYYVTITDNKGCKHNSIFTIPILSATDQITDLGKITAYPNPTSGTIQLYFDLLRPQSGIVEIFSTLGQVIEKQSFTNIENAIQSFDLERHPSGTYLFRVQLDNGLLWHRWVIKE
jgi:subtilisin-like proprotein convertase family protein